MIALLCIHGGIHEAILISYLLVYFTASLEVTGDKAGVY